jgi:hypothetical protein
MEGSKIGNTNP